MRTSQRVGPNRVLLLVVAIAVLGVAIPPVVAGIVGRGRTQQVVVQRSDAHTTVHDLDALYATDGTDEIKTFYLDVRRGAGRRDHSWAEVNLHDLAWYRDQGIDPYECEGLLQVGDDEGPLAGSYGYGQTTANVRVRLRGMTASTRAQKSYHVEVLKGSPTYEGQRELVLNKYVSDPTRLTTRLALGLMSEEGDLFSARTSFVRLYVHDSTADEDDGTYHDLGIYTLCEQVDSDYFSNRSLDDQGTVYEVVDFDWGRHADTILPAGSASFDEAAMDALLDAKGTTDNEALIDLLEAVGDTSTPIGEVLDRSFDRRNLYAFMAFHILTGNPDVRRGGYYLYKPRMLEQWWLISGDSRHAFNSLWRGLRDPLYEQSWRQGIHLLSDTVLFERVLKDDTCREELRQTVEALYAGTLSAQAVDARAQELSGLSADALYELPDRLNMRLVRQDYQEVVDALGSSVDDYYQAFERSMDAPWPFALKEPTREGDRLTFSWESAWLAGDVEPRYRVRLASSWTFDEPILTEDDLTDTSITIAAPGPGQYFLEVVAYAPDGSSAPATTLFYNEDGYPVYGVACFYVRAGGEVDVSSFDTETLD